MITISSDPPGPLNYEVKLPKARPTAMLTISTSGGGQVQQEVVLNLDTVIIEPELDRYMVIWRGIVWGVDIEASPPENCLELKISGGV